MSTKTAADKLQIKPNTTVWASDFARLDVVRPLPDGVRRADGPADAATALVFADDAASLKAILEANKDEVSAPATFWVAYPKANKADINRDSLWPIVRDYGMRPNGQIAIDDTWSALRFRADRPGEAPFSPSGR